MVHSCSYSQKRGWTIYSDEVRYIDTKPINCLTHMILYRMPPVIRVLLVNINQPQATVISRVTGSRVFS